MWVDEPLGYGWDRCWQQGGRWWWFERLSGSPPRIHWLASAGAGRHYGKLVPGGATFRGYLDFDSFAQLNDAWRDLSVDPTPFLMEIAL